MKLYLTISVLVYILMKELKDPLLSPKIEILGLQWNFICFYIKEFKIYLQKIMQVFKDTYPDFIEVF